MEEASESPPRLFRKLTLPARPTQEYNSDSDSDVYMDRSNRPRRRSTRGGYYDSPVENTSDSESNVHSSDESSPDRYKSSGRGRHYRERSRSRTRSFKYKEPRSTRLERKGIYPFLLRGNQDGAQSFTEDGSSDGELGDSVESATKASRVFEPSHTLHSAIDEVHYIYNSRYTGEKLSYGGLQSAELTTGQFDGKSSKVPLFRWIHLKDEDMNFDVFQDRVDHIPNLNITQRTAITKLLRKVEKKFDSPLQVADRPVIRIMEPGFLPTSEWPDDYGPVKKEAASPTTATWICFPYFCLDQYQGLFANIKKGAHPMHTLLQMRSSLVNEKREKQQAVCQISENSKKLCFHVGQLWCLILDDSLLVTCGRMSFRTLKGEIVSLNEMPGPSSLDSPRILVSYGSSVLWMFTVDECPTWVSFTTRFWQFQPSTCEILYHGQPVNSASWPRILEYATRSEQRNQGPLRLSFRLARKTKKDNPNFMAISPKDLEPPSTTINTEGEGEEATSTVPDIESTASLMANFAVFTELNRNSQTSRVVSAAKMDTKQLHEDLERMNNFLTHQIEPHERIAYKECPESSRKAVFDELRAMIEHEQRNRRPEDIIRTEAERSLLEFKKDFVGSCDYIFKFFFPPTLTGPGTGKFWGALHRIISANIPYDDMSTSPIRVRRGRMGGRTGGTRGPDMEEWEFELENLVKRFRSIGRKIMPFNSVITQAAPVDRAKLKVPESLPNAWIHLVMALVLYMEPRLGNWELKADATALLLNRGIDSMLKSIITLKPILADTVFTPFDLATLLVFRLAKDVTDSRPDIEQTYAQHLTILDNEVKTKSLDRSHQARLQLFKEELAAITKTLKMQDDVVASITCNGQAKPKSDLRTYVIRRGHDKHEDDDIVIRRDFEDRGYDKYGDAPRNSPYAADDALFDEFFKNSRRDPGGFREFLVRDLLSGIASRKRRFDEMSDEGSDLAKWNLDQIDTNRDRQDSAIYVFTVVTVIFLPLSTVAGILGMNTNDVRNMDVNQWVFWVVALPLTLIIIFAGLVATGELRNFFGTLVGLWVQRKTLLGGGGWAVIQEDSGYDWDKRGDRRRRIRVF
ncbi:hypothetical protein BGW36DRAFT_77825 [Talaromyces proteolyticus]|uniref:Mg2+ transporter n=1 Tax=Talaromyces proteolyticus TaxID=1131652 RepID=A0AAD4KDQ0_9EURO|nr:uncharacterized protein BGW36DRAFT_77825 [Talaromyces proteolyticus]KAH8689136.1 hypothetical protein BGW36DRAFT_77825 [Talaromyces proteolyticus]